MVYNLVILTMVRTVKSASVSAPAATTTAVAATPAKAAAVPKTPKTPKNKIVDPSSVPAAATTTVAAVVESVETSEVVEGDESIATKLVDFNTKLQQIVTLASALKVQFKSLEKIVNREMKAANKASSKKSKRSGNRQPSGFVRPTLISDELADFLGKAHGTEMARTEVSKEINMYIRTNTLQDKANGRQINADSKLTTLLKLESTDVLTYFNLQKFMKHHFVKRVVAPVVEV